MNPDWQKEFFSHRVVLDLWRKVIRPEQTRSEADFLETMLGSQARLLDVPCGNGRHSLELAKRGCRVTGVDISDEFIAEARDNARSAGIAAEFVAGDMRHLDYSAEFDGAFCFGNSFGYFDYAGITAFLSGISRSLEQNGRFVMDSGMAAESILPTLKEREWMQVDDILFAFENRYHAAESCLETEATFVRDGKTETHKWWHCVYTVAEISRLLEQAGLETIHTFSSTDEQPYKLGSQRLLLVARKR
jgi:SAM-dependent methyltransferase